VAALLFLGGCSTASPSAQAPPAPAALTKIRYSVSGTTNQASVTFQTPTGTSQQNDIDIPLRTKDGYYYLEFAFTGGAFVYLSAQNSNDRGSLTCHIETANGQVLSENTASGGYAIAACQGRAP
jgi:hypothetical protein